MRCPRRTGIFSLGILASAAAAALAAAPSMTALLHTEDCVSGLRWESVVATRLPIDLYAGDRGCRAKLLVLSVAGTSYRPIPGRDFDHYGVGEKAQFAENSATAPTTTRVLHARVTAQLPATIPPIEAGEGATAPFGARASYRVGEARLAVHAPGMLALTYGPIGRAGRTAADVPDFAIQVGGVHGVVPQRHTLRFAFALACREALTSPSNPMQVACTGIRLRNISYVLVLDSFSGVPCTTANLDPCANLFRGNLGTRVAMPDDFLAPTGAAHGGFRTKRGDAALSGPDNVHQVPQMLLVLKNGDAYQFFNIDLNVSTVTPSATAPEFP